MPHTLPAALVARLAADLLWSRAESLSARVERNPRLGGEAKAEGRRKFAAIYRDAARSLRALSVRGDVSAETVGLLLAWCGGHQDALTDLQDGEPRIEAYASEDYAGVCRLVLGAK